MCNKMSNLTHWNAKQALFNSTPKVQRPLTSHQYCHLMFTKCSHYFKECEQSLWIPMTSWVDLCDPNNTQQKKNHPFQVDHWRPILKQRDPKIDPLALVEWFNYVCQVIPDNYVCQAMETDQSVGLEGIFYRFTGGKSRGHVAKVVIDFKKIKKRFRYYLQTRLQRPRGTLPVIFHPAIFDFVDSTGSYGPYGR